jgi:hypothetical protein
VWKTSAMSRSGSCGSIARLCRRIVPNLQKK